MRKLMIMIGMLAVLAGIAHAANFWACFNYGEAIDFCNSKVPDRTCSSVSGCKICMSVYDPVNGCWVQGNHNICSTIPGGGCSAFGGGANIDAQPPNLTMISPLQDNSSIFTTKNILFEFTVDERATIYYTDINTGRGRWTKVCERCFDYSRYRKFTEGFNQLSLKAVDQVGNIAYLGIEFFVDSVPPRVSLTLPRAGNSDGTFYVEFTEANPSSVMLTLGNGVAGWHDVQVDLSTCIEPRKGRTGCYAEFDVKPYEGQDFTYWFTVIDIVSNSGISPQRTISGPLPGWGIPPELMIAKPLDGDLFTSLRIPLKMTASEAVEFIYLDNDDSRGRWNRVCKDCVNFDSDVRFKEGLNDITFKAIDLQGDEVVEDRYFFIDTIPPRISNTYPRRGLTNGVFTAEFAEANPVSMTLHYGNDQAGMRHAVGNLDDCEEVRAGRKSCEVDVDLSDYEGQAISYWFEVEDIVGNKGISLVRGDIGVDTIAPIIDDFTYEISRNRVAFTFKVTEDNFGEIIYYDAFDSRPSWKRLCSRIDSEGVCYTTRSFRDGPHDLLIRVIDLGGNAADAQAAFTIG